MSVDVRAAIVALVVLALFLPGCGEPTSRSASRPATESSQESRQQPSLPSNLLGTYIMTVTRHDRTKQGRPRASYIGSWVMRIAADGTISVNNALNLGFELRPTRFTESEVVLPPGVCPDSDIPPRTATYRLAATDKTIRFSKVADPCTDRVFILTAHAWRAT